MIYLAFYKGHKQGCAPKTLFYRFLDWGVRTATRGEYSHCELAVRVSGNLYDCYSASMRDGGVRCKTMTLPPEKWDLIAVPQADLFNQIKRLYNQTNGAKYDYFGAVGVLWGGSGCLKRWFCSEWCAVALELPESWRLSPNQLAAIYLKEKEKYYGE